MSNNVPRITNKPITITKVCIVIKAGTVSESIENGLTVIKATHFIVTINCNRRLVLMNRLLININ